MSIRINLDETNKFEFNVKIEAFSKDNKFDNTKVRFILEQNDINYFFEGRKENNNFVVIVPPMNYIKENVGKCSLEVIVEDRYFKTWESDVEFGKSMKVESTFIDTNKKSLNEDIKVTTSLNVEDKQIKEYKSLNINKVLLESDVYTKYLLNNGNILIKTENKNFTIPKIYEKVRKFRNKNNKNVIFIECKENKKFYSEL
jgi:hypothetical protein